MIEKATPSSSLPPIAVIGCGAWGKNLIRNFAELGVLSGVYDVDTERGKALSSQYNVPFFSETEIFESPIIQGVVIASLAPFHSPQATAALKAGKHVYIEKPMALSLEEAKELCFLAKEQNRVLMVGHILNYHPAFLALKERLSELGPLQHIYANRLGLGRFRRKESVLWDLACHDISLILSLAQEMPKSVEATGQAFLSQKRPASALLTLTFPSGLTAHMHTSWVSPFKEQKLVVMGEQAIAVFDDRKPWSEKLQISKDYLTWEEGQPHANDALETDIILFPETEPLKNECLHFLECIQTGATPLTSGFEGLRITEVLEKAEKSLERNP